MTLIQQFISYLGEHIGDAYVWGARGQCLTDMSDPERWIRNKETSSTNTERAMRFIAKSAKKPLYAFDCSGLICGFLMAKGLSGRVNSRTMYAKSKRIHRDELQPGDLVFRYRDKDKSGGGTYKYIYHVGVYVGNDKVIESKGRDDGVVMRGINASGPAYWNEYGRWDIISGDAKEDAPKEETPAVAKKIELTTPMMRGNDIKALQTALNALGYDAGDADGIAGKNTIAAIRRFAGDYANAGEKELPEVLQATVSVDGKIYVGTLKK